VQGVGVAVEVNQNCTPGSGENAGGGGGGGQDPPTRGRVRGEPIRCEHMATIHSLVKVHIRSQLPSSIGKPGISRSTAGKHVSQF
jgi:hypothetical protein